MSEKISLKNRPGKTRSAMIKKCPRCGGNPTLVDFHIDANAKKGTSYKGQRCSEGDCLLVKNWELVEPPKEDDTEADS